ncbi:MAG TPA: ubiquinol oxidase subunit II [Candidatus Paceibacterota bacterium]|nr:ubiquinol oxidase subunit II [Candidatus Paceibacterota bacterium]
MHFLDSLVMLHPRGMIALSERSLMLHTIELMLIVAVPVYILIFFFAWKYRAGNTSSQYTPEWEHSKMDELVWWAIPLEIILVLAALTWTSTHALDPYKPIDTSIPPLTVQVVALDWKWLFIYPAQGIASVNYLAIPVGQPVRFELTADAPMNALWIPQLGGQEMAMPGMDNRLNLEASAPGTFVGMSSNFSGDGFSGMQFPVHAVSQSDFDAWAAGIASSSAPLTMDTYMTLAKPSENVPAAFYILADPNLYTEVMMQYMMPQGSSSSTPAAMPGMQMDAMPGMSM